MENLYNRVENLDEQIRSVKLPYMAWKVLFLVDKESESNKIASILEADIEEVKSSLALLLENNLVVQTDNTAVETKPVEEPKVEAPSPEPEPELEEESLSDPIPEPVVEETAKEEENTIDVNVSDDDEFEVAAEPVEKDSVIEPTSQEEAPDDIEIKISEEEETESSEDMEFNFNLAGDEEKAADGQHEELATETESEPEPVIGKSEPQEKSAAGGKKILVIDDSLVIRKMVEIALEDEEYAISTAVSGKEGLEALDKVNPDLVILDMMLPDINGIEILKTIKASKGIPVIMLSGKDSPQMIESAKNEGAEEFLPKPFKDDDLVEKIKNLL